MIGRPLMTMPLCQRRIARTGDRRAIVVGAVAGNIDDPPQPVVRVLVEQRHREIDRPGDRGARRPADRRLHDLVGDGVRRFRTVDHAPGNDDLLVVRRRPFEIGHRDLAGRHAFQRLQEFLGDDGLCVTLALDGEFVDIHRVGDVDGEDQLDIDRRLLLGRPSDFRGRARPCRRRRLRPSPPRPAPLRSRHTSALLPPASAAIVTRKARREKQEHRLALHIRVSRRLP